MYLFGSSRTAFILCGSQEPFSFQLHNTIQVVWSWAACEIHHREEIAQGTKEQAAVLRQDSQKLPHNTSSYITLLTRKSGKCSLNSEEPYVQLSIEFSRESKAITGISRELFPTR